mgnify:CR=1 FL=1
MPESGQTDAVKIVAIGDVHGNWPTLWRVLRASGAADNEYRPSPALRDGRIKVVCLGDLLYYRDDLAYSQAAGVEPYDSNNPEHLRRAARAQFRELYRLQGFVEAAQGNVTVLLGNLDDAALCGNYRIQTRTGTPCNEFDPQAGGLELPEQLRSWLESFPREIVINGVHFAHAGPTPGMQQYDDFFYYDSDAAQWWRTKPELFSQTGHRFGVYGHAKMQDGIYVNSEQSFAMIDALGRQQYMELIVSSERLGYSLLQL